MDALIETGIVSREDRVRRVVLDVEVGNVPVLYIEQYGDDRVLQVVAGLRKTEIRITRAEDAVALTDTEVRP